MMHCEALRGTAMRHRGLGPFLPTLPMSVDVFHTLIWSSSTNSSFVQTVSLVRCDNQKLGQHVIICHRRRAMTAIHHSSERGGNCMSYFSDPTGLKLNSSGFKLSGQAKGTDDYLYIESRERDDVHVKLLDSSMGVCAHRRTPSARIVLWGRDENNKQRMHDGVYISSRQRDYCELNSLSEFKALFLFGGWQ